MNDPELEQSAGQSVMVGFKKNANVKFEDFKIVTLLGRGTFGKVFLAQLPSENNRQFAIKAIRKDVLLDFKQVANTKLEKDILFSCDHPFLVGMEYMFQSQTRLYFVMPFVRGGELYKIFKSRKRLPENLVKFYSLQIAMAVGYLHSKGIMHRDLKLDNVLIHFPDRSTDLSADEIEEIDLETEPFVVKIADLGYAREFTSDPEEDRAWSFRGSPLMMPAE